MPRRFPIFQFPNPPLIVATLAGALASSTEGAVSRDATLLSRLALLAWSAGEITRGANWFRRLIGLLGGTYGLIALGGQRARTGVRGIGLAAAIADPTVSPHMLRSWSNRRLRRGATGR